MAIRTRFAPSPTGYMHIGNLRSALYAYLFARKNNGVFLLRIEDTDEEREVEGVVDVIYSTLRSVGINWDEGPDVGGPFGPYIQSERKDIYLPHAQMLIESGRAYRCFCTKDELEERREKARLRGETFKYDKHCLHLSDVEIKEKLQSSIPYVIRQNVPTSGTTTFSDLLFGDITVENSTLDDNVLLKSNFMPTYNFANVVDDHLMEITHVMRGMEYLSSTPKYNLLYESFGWDIPEYIHMPPIMKDERRKLSKRDGDAAFEDFIEKGYLKEAVINYISLLGWSSGDDREMFSLNELIDAFEISGMSKSPAIFDIAKLRWLNAEYVRKLSESEFNAYAQEYYVQAGIGAMDKSILFKILQPRVEIFSELPEMVSFLGNFEKDYDIELFVNKKAKTSLESSKESLTSVLEMLKGIEGWNEQGIHDILIGHAEKNGIKNGTLLWPVRIAVSGKAVTPGGAIEILTLLGKDESIKRLKHGLMKLG